MILSRNEYERLAKIAFERYVDSLTDGELVVMIEETSNTYPNMPALKNHLDADDFPKCRYAVKEDKSKKYPDGVGCVCAYDYKYCYFPSSQFDCAKYRPAHG